MTAFAANSILCRIALRGGHIDPAAFTTLRLVSGALALWLMVKLNLRGRIGGDWGSALALAVYAAAFSFAYLSLTAGMGALLLFGAVQASMLVAGLTAGERLKPLQGGGFALAVAGLVWLVLPGISAPPFLGAVLMLAAGVAWGVYSLRGRGVSMPALATTGNFLRATPLVALASLPFLPRMHADRRCHLRPRLRRGVLGPGLRHLVRGSQRPQRHPRRGGTAQRAGAGGAGWCAALGRRSDATFDRRVHSDLGRHRACCTQPS